jgi:uncharacterized SAM-binding protein YcdF (DUF218 family)
MVSSRGDICGQSILFQGAQQSMFVLKKFVSRLFFPLPVCTEILLVGLILVWFTRRQKAGKVLVTLGAALLLLMGNRSLSSRLLIPLEHHYPPLAVVSAAGAPQARSEKLIVVLSGGYTNDPRIPADSQLAEDTLARVVEGVELHRAMPGTKLLLSGGGVDGTVPASQHMARVAEDLGVSREDIVLESESKDTEEQARLVGVIVGREPFILVTSASHMPRAVALFRKAGTSPVPAPTDYLARRYTGLTADDIYPSAEGVVLAERAVYEYLGLAWAKLRGQI